MDNGCLWRLALRADIPGAICLFALVISGSSTGVLDGGQERHVRPYLQARIFKHLASDADNEHVMIDATILRAHQHSVDARKRELGAGPPGGPAAA